jgi:hypothetical protein
LQTKGHGVTSQKTPFFIVTAVKTSNLTKAIESVLGKTTNSTGRRWKYLDSHIRAGRIVPQFSEELAAVKFLVSAVSVVC